MRNLSANQKIQYMKVIKIEPVERFPLKSGSHHGTEIQTTVLKIAQTFGDALINHPSGDGKCVYNWMFKCTSDDGSEFGIWLYDWKEPEPIRYYDRINWHIGGDSGEQTDAAGIALLNALNEPIESITFAWL